MNQRAFAVGRGILLCLCLCGAAAPAAHAQLFGPSDEEKAREATQDSRLNQLEDQAQQLTGRVQALEDRVRSLTDSLSQATGNNENLHHQIDLLNQKISAAQKDFSYRLCVLSAQQLGADAQGLNCGAGGSSAAMAPPPPSGSYAPGANLPPLSGSDSGSGGSAPATGGNGAPTQLGRPPGILGTLPSGPSSVPSDIGAQPHAQNGSGSYNSAMNLLARAQYDEAKAAFRAYADAHPDDGTLSPQAIYWIGDIDFVQKNYPDAARAFAEQIKTYPKSPRGPDSMLKLGQSLLAMGQTKEGCTTLGALKSKFPDASDSVVALAQGARKASCRR